MVALDLLIDPLASGPLGYWIWEAKGWFCGVPLVNFFGWVRRQPDHVFHFSQTLVSQRGYLIYRPEHCVVFFSDCTCSRCLCGPHGRHWIVYHSQLDHYFEAKGRSSGFKSSMIALHSSINTFEAFPLTRCLMFPCLSTMTTNALPPGYS